uniref:Mitochondrial potassium channel ATP-binding subunit n=1 Tax=Clastoptera arizonana TaxID=38151 RepID=A0A1B6CLY8_9HEMI
MILNRIINGLKNPFSKNLFDSSSYLWKGNKRLVKTIESRFRNISSKSKSLTTIVLFGLSGYTTKCLMHANIAKCSPIYENHTEEKEETDQKFDWYTFFEFLKPDIWILVVAVGAAFVVAVLNIQLPIYLGNIINVMTKFLKDQGSAAFTKEMKKPVMQILSLYVAQAAATFIYISLLSNVGERLAARMKCTLFDSIIKQDIEFFDKKRTGELVDCIAMDIQEFKSAFKLCISQGLRSTTQILGCAVSLYFISPAMTAAMLVVVPSVILSGTLIGSLLRIMSRKAQLQSVKATTISEEAISNIRTVRAFANESLESHKFNNEVYESCRLQEQLGIGIGLFQAGTNLFLNGLVLGTLYMGGYLMASQDLSAGHLMSFLVATQTIQRSLTQLSLLFGQFVKGIQAGTRAFQYINLEPSILLTEGKQIPYHSLVADVEFKKITFAYPTRPKQVILKDFDLTIPAGKTVAIVGSSGNGKSTIASLLERFYDVNFGEIIFGGVNLTQLNPSWLRGKAIGLINQEPVLFATTVMENIRYGKPEASDKQVFEAARLANADTFIKSFPEGYNTLVGERGVTVSGGQKQRIAIARALLKDPSVLILDEATSALDTESEKIVQQALDQLTKNRTVLIIAHRLSTVKNADIIVVLNNGVIVEMGNHETLMRKKGKYWNLMNQQELDKESRNNG